MKHQIKLVFLGCFVTSFCSAQAIDPGTPARTTNKKTVPIIFNATDSCFLRIDGVNKGKIARNKPKTIMLLPGQHEIFLESLETGETITNRSFRLTPDSIKGGKYNYLVTFEQKK